MDLNIRVFNYYNIVKWKLGSFTKGKQDTFNMFIMRVLNVFKFRDKNRYVYVCFLKYNDNNIKH